MRQHDRDPFVVSRDVKAVLVPAGIEVKLRTGSVGYITQALGGSFTVYVEGNLFRVAGADADAIGREPPATIELPPDATDADVERLAWEQLKTCYDPEIPVNIVDLGLVYSCEITRRDEGSRLATVRLTLTAPGCGMGEVLVQDVKDKLEQIPTITATDVDLVFDPPWSREMMSEAARLQTGMM
ncbi:MAG: putative Fe-S cluster assembly protein SufT [Proteobacteria bacterium]|nr:putative Fe-S cluster assembly protein SufT [Pseudomonadota bacterium]